MNTVPNMKKAAILLSSLDKEHLSALLAMLSGDEIKKLTSTIKGLSKNEFALLPSLVKEFSDNISQKRILGSDDEISSEIESQFIDEENVDNLIKRYSIGKDVSVWDKLNQIEALTVARYLKNESPQTIAVVLSKLNPKHSAEIISTFPSSDAAGIVDRMLNLKPLKNDVLANVEKSIRNDLVNNVPQNYADNYAQVVGILDSLKRDDENRILGALENNNSEAADKIRDTMLCFEDIGMMDDGSIKFLLEHIDKDKMVVALRGASEKLKSRFFINMSSRAKKVIKNEMEILGPVKLKDIETAQHDIITIVKDLAKSEQIVIEKIEV